VYHVPSEVSRRTALRTTQLYSMSKFYFGGGSEGHSSDDEDNLPYPEALPRSDFLSKDFDAPTYLSTLADRHQTLEDLRTDLRERSQALSQELLDLVNTNYEQFLSLGSDLKGGDEKVEDVRMGLLGFKRGVEDVRMQVRERKHEVGTLLDEKKNIGKDIAFGRKLLELDARLEDLEDRLMVSSLGRGTNGVGEEDWSESEDDEDDDNNVTADGVIGGTSTRKLRQLVLDYRHIDYLLENIGREHPFIIAQGSRITRIRNTILLDLNAATKHAAALGDEGKVRLVKMLSVYREFGAGEEAVKLLRDLKSK
jgi:hypothetical protein